MKLDPYFTTYTKINSKWIVDPKQAETVKFLAGNIGSKSLCPWIGNDFLAMTPKSQVKKIINYIKINNYVVERMPSN